MPQLLPFLFSSEIEKCACIWSNLFYCLPKPWCTEAGWVRFFCLFLKATVQLWCPSWHLTTLSYLMIKPSDFYFRPKVSYSNKTCFKGFGFKLVVLWISSSTPLLTAHQKVFRHFSEDSYRPKEGLCPSTCFWSRKRKNFVQQMLSGFFLPLVYFILAYDQGSRLDDVFFPLQYLAPRKGLCLKLKCCWSLAWVD